MKGRTWLLLLIFAVSSGIRIYLALQTPHFSSDSAYFVLRQAEHIRETGLALYNDPLSYGGREYLFLPVFHYLLAGFSFIMPMGLAAKVLPNLLASSIVFVAYLLVRQVTRDYRIAMLAAFTAGFVPVFISETINSVSPLSLFVPLAFLLYYVLLRRQKHSQHLFLAVLILLALTSPYTVIIVLSMCLFIAFSWVEGFRPTKKEVELTLFSVFLVLWIYLLFYRDALLMHGPGIIWQNMPAEVRSSYYGGIQITHALGMIGLIPMVCGLYVTFYYIFRKKSKPFYLFLSLMLIVSFLLLLHYIPFSDGLVILGVLSVVLFGQFISVALEYLSRTKLVGYSSHIIGALFIVFFLTSLVPATAMAKQKIDQGDPAAKIFALQFLREIAEPGTVIVSSVYEGNLITYWTGHPNVMDTNFLGQDAEKRLRDIRTIYTSAIESKPLEIMRKYNATYIVLSKNTMSYYNISWIAYADSECFPAVFSGDRVQVYEKKC